MRCPICKGKPSWYCGWWIEPVCNRCYLWALRILSEDQGPKEFTSSKEAS